LNKLAALSLENSNESNSLPVQPNGGLNGYLNGVDKSQKNVFSNDFRKLTRAVENDDISSVPIVSINYRHSLAQLQ